MESAEEDALLGEESEEEHSELSDSEVSYCCHANISQPKLTTVKLSKWNVTNNTTVLLKL